METHTQWESLQIDVDVKEFFMTWRVSNVGKKNATTHK